MQNTILCYINLPYISVEYLIRISVEMNVGEFVETMNNLHPSNITPIYVYDLSRKIILNNQHTFQETKTKSGAYLYLI